MPFGDGSLYQGGGKKGLNPECILKIGLTGFADGLGLGGWGGDRKRGLGCLRKFWLEHRKDAAATNRGGRTPSGAGLGGGWRPAKEQKFLLCFLESVQGSGILGSAFNFTALSNQEITLLLIHYQAPSERKVSAPNEDSPSWQLQIPFIDVTTEGISPQVSIGPSDLLLMNRL